MESWFITTYKENLMEESTKEVLKEELKKQLEVIAEQAILEQANKIDGEPG